MKKNCIMDELRLAWYSKIVFGFILVALGTALLIFYMQYSFYKDAYGVYLHTVEFYQESGLEAEPDMEREIVLQKNLNSATSGMTDDAINYDYAVLQQALYSSQPEYSLELAGEGAGLFFSVIFGVLGILFTTIDYKNKSVKHRVGRNGKEKYILGKLAALLILDVFVMAVYFSFAKIMGFILWNKVSSGCEIAFASNYITYEKNTLIIILFETFAMAVVYSFVGAFLGTLFKNAFAGAIIIVVFPMLPNFLGQLDLGNAFLFIEKRIYSFYGAVSCSQSSLTSLGKAAFVVLAYGILTAMLSWILVKKRSSYN